MTTSSEALDEELAGVGIRGRPGWRSILVTWLRRLLLTAVLTGAGYYLVTRWGEFWESLRAVTWYAASASLLAVVAGVIFGAFSWQTVVNDLGQPVNRLRGAQIYLVSQLGKYLPGSVWAYVLQMELGRKVGLPRARMFIGSLVQVGVSVVAMLTLGMIALPKLLDENPRAVWLYLALPLSFVALHPRVLTWGVNLVLGILRKAPLDHRLHWSTIARTLGLSACSYVLFGVHLWLLASAGGPARLDVLLLCIGSIAVGLVAGLLFFIVPSGAGARDALIAMALAPTVGLTAAIAFAVVSRVMFTVAELLTAAGAALLVQIRHPETLAAAKYNMAGTRGG
jgi:hypothetical protein